MRKLEFDKKQFNLGYGFIYTILQSILALGFIFAVVMVLLNILTGATLTIPDALLPIVAAYIFVSIVGFPIVSIVKEGYKRLVKWSTLSCDGEKWIYDKVADRLWTAVGHVEEHHIYTISHIESVTVTRYSYIVTGSIQKVVMNNGRKLKATAVDTVKIPNAFLDMEKIATDQQD